MQTQSEKSDVSISNICRGSWSRRQQHADLYLPPALDVFPAMSPAEQG